LLKIYNTLTRKKEIFRPLVEKRVNLFVCGPTVYDYSHIGHARTYVSFDVIVKYMRYRGYNVYYLQNITDIEDKIITRAQSLKMNPLKLSKQEEKNYYEDMKALKIDSISKYARASDYIPQIIQQIKKLRKKGFAYRSGDFGV